MVLLSSAGVGRTGTFIAIDTEVQDIRQDGVVDVYNCVQKMRYVATGEIYDIIELYVMSFSLSMTLSTQLCWSSLCVEIHPLLVLKL